MGDHGAGKVFPHAIGSPLNAVRFEIGALFQKAASPLRLHLEGPKGFEELFGGQPKKKIGYRNRVKYRGVEEGPRSHARILFVESKLLGLAGELVEGPVPHFAETFAKGQHVPHPNAAVPAHPAKRKFARFQELDQVGARDAE